MPYFDKSIVAIVLIIFINKLLSILKISVALDPSPKLTTHAYYGAVPITPRRECKNLCKVITNFYSVKLLTEIS